MAESRYALTAASWYAGLGDTSENPPPDVTPAPLRMEAATSEAASAALSGASHVPLGWLDDGSCVAPTEVTYGDAEGYMA